MHNQYLSKYGFKPPQVNKEVSKSLHFIVVIPCFNEPDIISTLDSLKGCVKPNREVEVIIVVNQSENVPKSIDERNKQTVKDIHEWQENNTFWFSIHLLYEDSLPKKHAGVGLARKIGMDEAVFRFHQIDNDQGIIVCLDADCTVAPNYFQEIEQHFEDHPKTPGCAIHYEHPLQGNDFSTENYTGIINYELFLRYYNLGLSFAGFPYAYHTVGSSMAVRSYAYQKQGGMNKRKAGEDFYFLHKIIKLGGFTTLNKTVVYPSARTSERVPFGTGKAINDFLQQLDYNYYSTYDFEIFKTLKRFVQACEEIYENETYVFEDESLNQSLTEISFQSSINEIKRNTVGFDSFKKRFFQYFDAFKVLKFVHFARDNFYPNQEIKDQVNLLLSVYGINTINDKKEQLIKLRELEKHD